MAVERAAYRGNVNIGFYGVVTGSDILMAREFKKSEFFGDAEEVRVAGTDLVGIFAAGNANGIILPEIITEHEEEVLEEAGVDYLVLETDYTALGNLLLCNDNGCLASPHLEDVAEEIEAYLEVPVETGRVAGLEIPGSCGVATNGGVLLHRNASEEELQHAEEVLGVSGDIGTVNFGTPFVHSGVLADADNLLVGNDTKGPEVQRIQEALGFL
jgi:translation initiation factor 6